MNTWIERWMDGSAQGSRRSTMLSLAFGTIAVLVVALAPATVAAAQSAEIQAPGVNIKAEESGKAEIEALGVSIKVTPPEVRELPEGEAIDLSGTWKFKGDWLESGLSEGWYQPEFDDSDWRTLHVPASWESQGILTENPRWPAKASNCGYNGFAWYRTRFVVPESWADGRVELRLGQVWDEDWTYLNGTKLGQTTGLEAWDRRRRYLIPPDLLKVGQENVLAIRVLDREHEGGLAVGPVELVNVSEEAAAAAAETREYWRTRGDVVRFGSGITIDADERIRGDVVAFGGDVDVAGYIEGDLAAVGGSVHLLEGARVDGDVTAVGGDIEQEPGAIIGGEIVEVGPGISLPGAWFSREYAKGWRDHPRWTFPTVGLLGAIVVWGFLALLATLLFRERLETMAAALPVYPGRAVLYGLAGFVLLPAAVVADALVGTFLTVLL
ncbi:MAG: beta galactosidase jelly roll domain-containing protein, partial [Armatimonadetes bacterium]|nr:beta galactosidase jelly roll domain-containing protein [Armatimonadota bacterium]